MMNNKTAVRVIAILLAVLMLCGGLTALGQVLGTM